MTDQTAYVRRELNNGAYIAEYQNYHGNGMRGALAGTTLQSREGRTLLSDCRKEFTALRDELDLQKIEWRHGVFRGTEWRTPHWHEIETKQG